MTKRVAITGFSFRFPGTTAARYWSDLLAGRDLVTQVNPERWALATFLHPNRNNPGTSYTFAAGSIGDVAGFDAAFFGISPREAALMDPQQRLLLEMSWEAMENAGVRPSSLRGGDCGVFIGIASADYSYRFADDLAAIDASSATGNTASIAANRISYIFDLHGPSMAIDTACSSSLVAIHQACRAIVMGECSQALAGGVSLHMHPYGFIIFSKASMLSPRGRCHVFDADGDGYVRSEGGGIFLLKDYDQAVADGNPILAVITASAVNTDGRKSGLTVPNPKAQADLLASIYARAGIAPAQIDYVEAHGTGTAVGDPIETRALGDALGCKRPADQPLLIGSIKSNLGHLEAASGVAGLVKSLYCLQHRLVPATIGIQTLNPHIDFEAWNIRVVTANTPLKSSGRLILGVNSFGFGGANAHLVLESHEPSVPGPVPVQQPLPLVISAATPAGLRDAARDLAAFLRQQPVDEFYNIVHSAHFHRDWHGQRAVVTGDSSETMARELELLGQEQAGQYVTGVGLESPGRPAFIYSGNGSQWSGMARRLMTESALFRDTVAEIDALFAPLAGFSLAELLVQGEEPYQRTELAQPALFALQVGLTRLLRQWGIEAAAVAGHSVGEVAAAWAAGALSLQEAVLVIHHRSHQQGTTRGRGQMTAVGLGSEAGERLLQELAAGEALTLAGVNSSRGITVAGEPEALARLEGVLAERNVFFKRLDLDYAFHSPTMDPIRQPVLALLADLQPGTWSIPYYSTVTGDRLAGEALVADYWWRNIRQPVLFEPAIKQMQAGGVTVFLEIGPHPVLRGYLADCLKDLNTTGGVIPTLQREDGGLRRVWEAACHTMLAGCPMDWSSWFATPGRFIPLPNYPWQRERHWHPVTSESLGVLSRHPVHALLGYPLAGHTLTWENHLDGPRHPHLMDHVVGDATVFPGAGYVELALAAGYCWHATEVLEVEDLEIRAPLLLSNDHAKVVRSVIAARDGGFEVQARDLTSSDAWSLHAVGRLMFEPNAILLQQTMPALPARPPDFTGEEHLAMTRQVGLFYGPAFQAIDHGWREGNTVLARLRIPPVIAGELASHHLHPALLDCAFQLVVQLLKDDASVHKGIAFIPTRVGRVALRVKGGIPHLVRVELLHRSPHSLTLDVILADARGDVVAVLQATRFRGIRLHKNPADHLRFLVDALLPMPHLLSPGSPPPVSLAWMTETLREGVWQCQQQGDVRRFTDEIDPLLDSLCGRFVLEALQTLAQDEILAQSRITRWQHLHPEVEPLWHQLLHQGEEDGLLVKVAEGWRVVDVQEEEITARDIWNSLIHDYPDYASLIHAAGRVGWHLPALLTGERPLSGVLPREATLASLTRSVWAAAGGREIGQALRRIIRQAQHNLATGQRLGVVEVREGLSPLTSEICQSLDFQRGDYLFATTSQATLDEMHHLLEIWPEVVCQPIVAGETQGGSLRCQLALVTLDGENLENLTQALAFARSCLLPDGLLILMGQHPSRWMDFIFGGRRDWWLPAAAGGWISSRQPIGFWQQVLQEQGFVDATLLTFAYEAHAGPYLLAARLPEGGLTLPQPEQEASGTWLLMAEEEELADLLQTRLSRQGDEVTRIPPADQATLERMMRQVQETMPLKGVLQVAGLAGKEDDLAPADALARQVARCATAAAMVQACEGSRLPCWLFTAGAMAGQFLGETVAGLADASLLGFARTLMNETANEAVRLIDLPPGSVSEGLLTGLVRELRHPDAEREILLTANGERLVPRLALSGRPGLQSVMDQNQDAPTYRLGFQFPGQLRNLRWEAHPRTLPAEDRLEVEVQATGLNFRDVMYALGMLSDEAIENGFAGASLGLEFAGIVRRTGRRVSGFQEGDRVVGFGPSSFGTRVITTANAVAIIPPGISFEAAATIPSVFLTVYYAMHHLARLAMGERILIHGAAGGVGLAAIQLAKWLGAEIYATAGSDEKRDFLRLLGVEHIFDSRSLTFADEILRLTQGEGVDVVLNSLAGEAIHRNLRVLKPFGRFLELGKRDFYENTAIGLRPFRNNISYFGIDADQLMALRPDLTRRLFGELMALFRQQVLHPLPYHTFEAEEVVDAFRFMQQSRQIGKIVITYRNGIQTGQALLTAAETRWTVDPAASYLITGGTSGFGLKTAQWLAARGARHLVLVSRRGAADVEAATVLASLRQAGVTVAAPVCDITDGAALANLVQGLTPGLKGVVHSAMVIDDGLIRTMTPDQMERVFAPKILGAWHLHQATRHLNLDFFILYSSATTLFGNPGQANYVAANTWLESLARYRRQQGLPATCLRWGALDDTGYLARHEKIKEALQSRMGGMALNSTVALQILEESLAAGQSDFGVLDLDWRTLARFLPTAGTPRFAHLSRQSGAGDLEEDGAEDIQRMLLAYSDAELAVLFGESIKAEVGNILRIAPDKIDADRSIYEMGLDSLMGVELVVALESRFGVRLPVMALSESPTIAKLAQRIVLMLRGAESPGDATGAPDVASEIRKVASQHGADLSPDALARVAEAIPADLAQGNRMIQ